MDLNYHVNISCTGCESSIKYLLESFSDRISFQWTESESDFQPKLSHKSKNLKVTIDNSHLEEMRKHLSKNIYDDDENLPNAKVPKINPSVTFVTNDLTNCDKCHLIPFIGFSVSDNKLLGQIIIKLNESFPMTPQFRFLKRINSSKTEISSKVLLAPQTSQLDLKIANEYLVQNNLEPNCFTQYVYFTAPITKHHFDKYKRHWPCVFHPDAGLETLLLTNCGLSDSEVKSHVKLMNRAIDIGKLSQSTKKIGSVIYDPEQGMIVSEAYDCRDSVHPLCHAVVVALNRLSESQGGGLLAGDCKDVLKIDSNPGGYLSTGWDVYVSVQPCLMCSMALVHSRIGRLFYRYDSSSDGQLEGDDGVSTRSRFKLFSVKSLNHNFDVFEINV